MVQTIRALRPAATRTRPRPRLLRGGRAFAALCLAVPLLAACASDAPDRMASPGWSDAGSCGDADWNVAGVADALSGAATTEGLARIAACPTLDGAARVRAEDDYLAGHDEGVGRFCTYAKGVEMGETRRLPALSCPAPLARAFEAGMAKGRSLPARDPEPADSRAASTEDGYAPRVSPWLSIGLGSGGWSGVGWGINIGL